MKAIGNNIIIIPKKVVTDKTKGGLFIIEKDREDIRYKEATIHSVSDNIKGLYGSDGDLEIFHDSNNSFISEVGTGDLTISTNGTSIFLKTNSTESSADFVTNGYGSKNLML